MGEAAQVRGQGERLFDSTAADAAEQLAASLLAELLPPWSQWFGLRPGADVPAKDKGAYAELLEDAAARVEGHFDRSNFSVEIHQCFFDLVTVGTATILFQEAEPGSASAFRFSAVPCTEISLDADQTGHIRRHFRTSFLTLAALRSRFVDAALAPHLMEAGHDHPERTFEVVEAFLHEPAGTSYVAFLPAATGAAKAACVLARGTFDSCPLVTFRWLKAPGESYGRSPVMTALPDIKTANKVVELVLKNASIAVTGIWLADDDGVLNPANIKLIPGSIIPKAVGSAGLTPLQAPGRFDISQLVLDDLRRRIRHTLLVDRLGPPEGPRMTATEILERATESARLLGAVYGRLQAELLMPLLQRALAILRRRGEIGDVFIDGRTVDVDYRSPLARAQARDNVGNTMLWLDAVRSLGPEASAIVDARAAALWLARTLGVAGELVRHEPSLSSLMAGVAAAASEP
jgi:hypothetical protein